MRSLSSIAAGVKQHGARCPSITHHQFVQRRHSTARVHAAVETPAKSGTADRKDIADACFLSDEEAARMKAEAAFPIPDDKLIEMYKQYIMAGFQGKQGDWLADDFQFLGPVVGPLSKDEFLSVITRVDFLGAFPDWKSNFQNFYVDPMEPGRVWAFVRSRGTHTGKPLLPGIEPNGKYYEAPMEVVSVVFNRDGKVKKATVGVVADRQLGNTGGLGALFGILYALGRPLPFPEAQPWKMSWQYKAFNTLNSLIRKFSRKN